MRLLIFSVFALAACGTSNASDVADASPPPTDAGSLPDAGDSPVSPSDSGASDAPPPTGPLTDVTYTNDATSIFANTERGFYHHLETTAASYDPLDEASLRAYRENEGIAHVLRVFYLDGFVSAPISDDYIAKMRADFATVRAAGLRAIVRFAYTTDEAGADADVAHVLGHIGQIAPVLADNTDVLELVQARCIGAWGEWYYTTHFGNLGNIASGDWAARKSVVDALLAATTRPVQLRTPAYKRTMYGATELTDATAYSGTPSSRIGFHDDCFVADATDEGTFADIATEGPYLEAESRFVPVGGETCVYQAPRSACPSALVDMARYHYSFLNVDYHPDVIAHWKTDGCFDTMQRKLGYRFALVSGRYSATAARGGSIHVEFVVQNDGYAVPVNPMKLAIVLRNGTGTTRLALTADARRWLPGPTNVAEDVALGDVAPGTYDLALALVPADASLSARVEYAVRFANVGTWDAAAGLTALGAKVTIAP